MPKFDPDKYLKSDDKPSSFDPDKYLGNKTVEKKNPVQNGQKTGSQPLFSGSKIFQSQVDSRTPSVILSDEQKLRQEQDRIGKRFETKFLNVPAEFGKVAPAMKAAKKVKDTLPDTPEFRRVGEIQKNQPIEITEGQRLGESLIKGSDFQEITTDRLTNKKTALQKQLEQAKGAFASVQGEDVAREIDMYIQDPESFREAETNTWLGNAIRKGLLTGDLANAIPTADYNPSQEAIARAADANYKMGRIPESEAQKEYQKSGLGVFKNTLLGAQFLTETLASSFAGLYQAAKRTVPLAVGAGATAGSAFFGVGALPGAVLGLQSGLGVATLNLATSSSIIESLNESGVDITNRKELIKAFSDDEKMSKIRSKALKYGVPIMVFDLATAGIAGKLIGGTAGKSIAKKIGAGLGEAGIQATGGSTGELSGQYLSGKKIDWNEVAIEGIASLATGAPNVVIGAMTRDKTSSSNENIVAQINKFGAEEGAVDAKINLDRDLANGTINQEEYQQGIEFIEKAVVANDKIPIDIEGENREKSIDLIAKKYDILLEIEQLNQKKEGVDNSFHPVIDEQIKAKEAEVESINKGVQELSKSPTEPTTAQPPKETKKAEISPYGVIAADYLFTGGSGVILSTDYFIQALSGSFIKAGGLIEQIRNKYINKVGDLGNIRESIGTENYNEMIAEIRDAINTTYNNKEVNDIFDVVLNNATGFPSRLGNDVSARLEQINEETTTAQPTEEIKLNLEIPSNSLRNVETTSNALTPDLIQELGDRMGRIYPLDEDTSTNIANEYHKSKADGSNPELVKAVEDLLKPKQDAVQVETAGQVPVQPKAPVSEKVEQGKPEAKPKVVTEEGVKAEEVTPEQYVQDLQDTKKSDPEEYWSVDDVSVDDAKKGTIIKEDGGYGLVSKTGDIKGVFKGLASKAKNVADKILKKAVQAGGTKLDNFDTYLTKIYERNGFKVVSRIPFNEEFAPPGWNKEKHGTPDVVAMVYDPDNKLNIKEKSFTDYDKAIAYRDRYAKKVKETYPVKEETKELDVEVVKLNESNVENAIELLDDINENKRKSERASSKRKADLEQKILEAETELDKISEEAQIVKVINDNFDKIKKDLKEQGLLKVKC
jgi:hypothetical protein